MSLQKRLTLAAIALAVCVAGQLALQVHLAAGVRHAALRRPLTELPMTLDDSTTGVLDSNPVSLRAWCGEAQSESATLSAKITFADELIARYYRTSATPPAQGEEERQVTARLYAVYSRKGEDREHHPELCMRDVAGYEEDANAAALVPLDQAGARSVQRFRFRTETGQLAYVYYWHYTLAGERRRGQTALQALHQRFGPRPPSVTVQVSTGVSGAELELVERSFLPAVDQALQSTVLPADARLGHDRLPVRLVRNE
jgi:hypothetical protein